MACPVAGLVTGGGCASLAGPGGGLQAAGSSVTCSGQPGLALFPLLWLVTTQAVGLQLLRGLHVAFSLEVGCRCGGRRWQEPKGAGWT